MMLPPPAALFRCMDSQKKAGRGEHVFMNDRNGVGSGIEGERRRSNFWERKGGTGPPGV